MIIPVLLIFTIEPNSLVLKFFIAFLVMIGFYFLFGRGLRRFRFKKSDLKAAGLNHRQRRQWNRKQKRKNKGFKARF